jgi:hypothetical protein
MILDYQDSSSTLELRRELRTSSHYQSKKVRISQQSMSAEFAVYNQGPAMVLTIMPDHYHTSKFSTITSSNLHVSL